MAMRLTDPQAQQLAYFVDHPREFTYPQGPCWRGACRVFNALMMKGCILPGSGNEPISVTRLGLDSLREHAEPVSIWWRG